MVDGGFLVFHYPLFSREKKLAEITDSKSNQWLKRFRKIGKYLTERDIDGLKQETANYLLWSASKNKNSPSPQPLINPAADGSATNLKTEAVESGATQTGKAVTEPVIANLVTNELTKLANIPQLTEINEAEASFWASVDYDLTRRVSWLNISTFGEMAAQELSGYTTGDVKQLIAEAMDLPTKQNLRGLVLGCGDMSGDHLHFVSSYYSFAEIDAYDVNSSAFEQAKATTEAAGLKVNFHVADVSVMELPADSYDLVVVFHSFHHFNEIEHVAKQINRSLRPGGVFYTNDYVGPRKIQWNEKQLAYAQLCLQALPERYRYEITKTVRQEVKNTPPEQFSPDEANFSDLILGAIADNMEVVRQYNYAGLLYPLFEGIGFNYDVSRPEDRLLAEFFFRLDKILCLSGIIEPNFTQTIAKKKAVN
jgi:ubiquinone/menaquinone biosynthesis C-methylase UbiE